MNYVCAAIVAYLLGSINVAIIITKYFLKDDVRMHGSGNAGATNVARVFGWGPGLLTFACDFAKCALSMWIGNLLCGQWGYFVAGSACLIGHCFPLYFKFKGGKGVSTGACVALLIDWRLFLIVLGAFVIMVLITKIVSVASVAAAISLIISSLLMISDMPLKLLGVFTGALVVIMHWQNLVRLVKGEEAKFKAGKKGA